MTKRLVVAAASCILLAGCDLARMSGFGDGDVVFSPAYSANRVMLLEPGEDIRYSTLRYPAERRNARNPHDTRQAVLNRQPVSIIISKAYVPLTLPACVKRPSDAFFRGRDIAVLLDTSTESGSSTSLAVWYERGVTPGQHLTFENLLVYSTSAWDSRFPPYFRLRLIDVTAERNTSTRQALETVRENASGVGSLLNAPAGSPLIAAAAQVGDLVLANEANMPLMDFTFQLYGEQLAATGGGAPLGILQTGGLLLTAPPCPVPGVASSGLPAGLRHDNFEFEIEDARGVRQEMPFIYATLVSADMAVPDVVKARSTAIMTRLAQPTADASDIEEALSAVRGLDASLSALGARERFRATPNLNSLTSFVEAAVRFSADTDGDASTEHEVDRGVETFLLTALYQATGKVLESFTSYKDWLDRCGAKLRFDVQRGRVTPTEVLDDAGEACWTSDELRS